MHERLYLPHHLFAGLARLPHPAGQFPTLELFMHTASVLDVRIAQRRLMMLVVELPDACDPDMVAREEHWLEWRERMGR